MSLPIMIRRALINTLDRPDLGLAHFARPTGSYLCGATEGRFTPAQNVAWLFETLEMAGAEADVSVTETTGKAWHTGAAMAGARYFEVPVHRATAWQAAVPLWAVDKRKEIECRNGAHGPELVVKTGKPTQTRTVTIIVMPDGGKNVIATFFPGQPLPPSHIAPEHVGAPNSVLLEVYGPGTTIKLA